MPPVRAPVKPGSSLNRKSIGGLPLWAVVIGGAVSVFLVYKLYKNYQAGAGSSTAATSPTDATTPVDTSGGAGSSAASPTDLTPYEDLASALNGLTYVLSSGTSPFVGSQTGGDGSSTPATITGSYNTTTNNTSTTNITEPSPATQSPTFQPPPLTAAENTPLGIIQTAEGFGTTTDATQAQVQAAADAGSSYLQSITSGVSLGVPPPSIPAPPAQKATLVEPAKPVAGTTSNKDAVTRSKTVH